MKQKKKKLNKTILTVIITTLSALILAGVFFATYYIFTDRTLNGYEKNMKAAVGKINSTNKSTKQFFNKNIFDTELAKKNLPAIIKEIDDINKLITAEVPGDKYKLQHESIIEGLKANKLMYMQISNILQNPSSNDLKNSFSDFEKYRDNCENHYAQFSLGGISPSVLNEARDFLEAFKLYSNQLMETQINADIKASQTIDFVTKLDEIIGKFIPLKTDFSMELKKVREKASTYDELIALANGYRDKNSDLEKALLNTSVPENCKTFKDIFINLTDDYQQYIQSFVLAVNQEKTETETATEALSTEKLNTIYYDSNNRFLGVQDKYDNFLKQYTEFKSANIK